MLLEKYRLNPRINLLTRFLSMNVGMKHVVEPEDTMILLQWWRSFCLVVTAMGWTYHHFASSCVVHTVRDRWILLCFRAVVFEAWSIMYNVSDGTWEVKQFKNWSDINAVTNRCCHWRNMKKHTDCKAAQNLCSMRTYSLKQRASSE
jgi:hypothetical protein